MISFRNAPSLRNPLHRTGLRQFSLVGMQTGVAWITIVNSTSIAIFAYGMILSPLSYAQTRLSVSQSAAVVKSEDPGTEGAVDLRQPSDGPHLRHLYYWTTCAIAKEGDEQLAAKATLGKVSVGELRVSIPESHRPGAYERAVLGPDHPRKHFILQELSQSATDDWLIAIKASLAAANRPEILVMVHGFNMSFQDAAIRAAQWYHDSGYPGVVIMFAWPSQGGIDPDSYYLDQANASASVPALIELMEALAEHFPETPRHTLAHSLGCRMMMASAISMEAHANPESKPLDRVILAAPDIDDHVFCRVGLPALTSVAGEITVLCNSSDLALKLSSSLHGNRARTGMVMRDYVEFATVESIDVSGVKSLFGKFGLGHMYFTDCQLVMGEICRRLEGAERTNDRFSGVDQEHSAVSKESGN